MNRLVLVSLILFATTASAQTNTPTQTPTPTAQAGCTYSVFTPLTDTDDAMTESTAGIAPSLVSDSEVPRSGLWLFGDVFETVSKGLLRFDTNAIPDGHHVVRADLDLALQDIDGAGSRH